MAAPIESYSVVDDPETGQRWLIDPHGEWAEIDMRRVNDLYASGQINAMPEEARLVIEHLLA